MKSSANKTKEKGNPLEKLIRKLQDTLAKNHQATHDRLEQLETKMKENAVTFSQQKEDCLNEMRQMVNSVEDKHASQSGQISFMGKKIDSVERNIDLKIKHFDEFLKNTQAQYEKNVKDIQDDIKNQIERMANVETTLNLARYWHIGIGVIIIALVGGFMYHINATSKLNLAETRKISEQVVADNQKASQNLSQYQATLLETIKNDNRQLLEIVKHSDKQQLSTIQKNNSRILSMQKKDNQNLLSAIQKRLSDIKQQLSEMAELLQPEDIAPPALEPINEEQSKETGE